MLFGNNIKYKIRCRNGNTEFIHYDPDYSKPYTAGFGNLRQKTLDKAAKKLCGCN